MQIDFHHTITYVLARVAGFSHEEADIISKSAQYVDDNTVDKVLRFKNDAIYKPILSSHKALDYRNFDDLADHLVWVPFHFLPGNKGKDKKSEKDSFVERLICLKNSSLANDMITECIAKKEDENSLYRLGITMHVYADTWAHYGFSGIQNNSNKVTYLDDEENSRKLIHKVSEFFHNSLASNAIETACPLGHGAVLSYPDRPYLIWQYKNYKGNLVKRNNPLDYKEAIQKMYHVLSEFHDGEKKDLKKEWVDFIYDKMQKIDDEDKNKRHKEWINLISKGIMEIAPVKINYNTDEWEKEAFNGKLIDEKKEIHYSEDFEDCHWKKFNDALIDHHYYLTRIIFPKYGLCIL